MKQIIYKAIDNLRHDMVRTLQDIERQKRVAISLLEKIDELVIELDKEEK